MIANVLNLGPTHEFLEKFGDTPFRINRIYTQERVQGDQN